MSSTLFTLRQSCVELVEALDLVAAKAKTVAGEMQAHVFETRERVEAAEAANAAAASAGEEEGSTVLFGIPLDVPFAEMITNIRKMFGLDENGVAEQPEQDAPEAKVDPATGFPSVGIDNLGQTLRAGDRVLVRNSSRYGDVEGLVKPEIVANGERIAIELDLRTSSTLREREDAMDWPDFDDPQYTASRGRVTKLAEKAAPVS